MAFLEKIFGSFSDKELKKIKPIADQVLALEGKYKAFSDEQLQAVTPALKERLVNGETVELTGKEDYIFVDVFDRITFDLNAGNGRAIATLVNGTEAEFSQPLNNGDRVEIYWKEK